MELNFLEIFGTIVGLVYLWLEYRASIYLWIAGIVMPAIYIFVYYKAGLYADLVGSSGCGDTERKKVSSQQMLQSVTNPKTFLSCILHGNVTYLFFWYLLLHLSALRGY